MRYLLLFLTFTLITCTNDAQKQQPIEWQGHRGARGLMPENTIPAFQKAMELGVQTLELDLAVSADNQLVISHEPWFSEEISSHPDGRPVTKEEAAELALFKMNYDSIKKYDVGARGNHRFLEQQKVKAVKPLLDELIDFAENFAKANNKPAPYYNIEIKSRPEWDEKYTPSIPTFVKLVLDKINEKGIGDRVSIQSFDVRALKEVKLQAPDQTLVFLVSNPYSIEKNLMDLGFKPAIYSPYYKLVHPKMVDSLHELNIRIIPWTINDETEMERMISYGVDGIITDYPNRIPNKEKE